MSLRVVINVGEQLRVTPEIRRLCSANPGLVLENQYGPTETHEVASYTMSGSPDDFPTLPPIGTAIDGATIACSAPTCVRSRPEQRVRSTSGAVASHSVTRHGPTSPPSGSSRSVSTARGCIAPVISASNYPPATWSISGGPTPR